MYCDILQEDVESIIGGAEATPRSRPYLVSLGRSSSGNPWRHSCGGSLISPRAVLTAAHCMFDPNNGSFNPADWVDFNRHDLRVEVENEPGAVRITVGPSDQIPHPRYNPETDNLDVAVIILPRAMTEITDITPATLNEDSSVPAGGAPLDIAGWGATTTTGGDPSPVLKFTTVDYITNRECTSAPFQYPPGRITRNMMCAAQDNTGSTCFGDSGKCLSV